MHRVIDQLQNLSHVITDNWILLEITSVTIGSLTALEMVINLGLKILIGAISATYLIWKFKVEYKKHKKENP